MKGPVRGKVAQILSDQELVINVGAANNVYVGMLFKIVETTQVKDPDSSKILGTVERPKVTIKVIEVQPQLSVAATLNKSMVSGKVGPYASSLLSPYNVLVRVGDTVVQEL